MKLYNKSNASMLKFIVITINAFTVNRGEGLFTEIYNALR